MAKGVDKKHSLLHKMLTMNGALTLAIFVLCSVLFVFSISRIINRYVNYDVDFFLTQVVSNFEKKAGYMEEALQRVRTEKSLMDWQEERAPANEETEQIFRETVDLSSATNVGDGRGALTDAVYFFGEDGVHLSAYYFILSESEYAEREELATAAYTQIKAGGTNRSYLVYPVLDDEMNRKGDLFFHLNEEAIALAMEEVKNYRAAFWLVRNEEGCFYTNHEETANAFLQTLSGEQKTKPYTAELAGMKTKYRVYEKELALGLRMAIGIPKDQMATLLNAAMYPYFIGILLIMVVAGATYVFFSVRITRPLRELTTRIKALEEGDYESKLPDYEEKEFHEISTAFNEMTGHMNHLINEVYEKQLAITRMDLKFVQSQMNPHFMFNVLNTISLQAGLDGNQKVSRMLTSFTKLIQAKIYRSDKEKVRVRQELEYVTYYLSLQNDRYGDSLKYEINSDDEAGDCLLPKLCIQLLVENAVCHGLEPKMGKGFVNISIRKNGDRLNIRIEDDGIGFKGSDGSEISLPIAPGDDQTHNQVGIHNLNQILSILYGEAYALSIRSKEGEGTAVELTLPAETESIPAESEIT